MAATTMKDIKNLSDFLEALRASPVVSDGFYTYRGERDASWKINPGIFRDHYKNVLAHERDATRDLIAVHPHEFAADTSMFDRLVRMQHYNLPTRLLDVTANPLVGLYFAVEKQGEGAEPDAVFYVNKIPNVRSKYYDSDTVSCLANLANLSTTEKDAIYLSRNTDRKFFNKKD